MNIELDQEERLICKEILAAWDSAAMEDLLEQFAAFRGKFQANIALRGNITLSAYQAKTLTGMAALASVVLAAYAKQEQAGCEPQG